MQNQMPPIQSPDNTFHDGNPLTGELGTIVTALFMNNVQSAIRNAQAEILAVLADAGVSVDPAKSDQLLTALKKNYVLQTRKVNNKALSADITLGAGDVGAYTKDETNTALGTKLDTSKVQKSPDDTTASALVINGGHGLGANACPRAAGATGGVAGCGFFSYTANHADNPFGGTGASGLHVQESATYGWDLLGHNGGGVDFRLRQISNGVAIEWSTL
ncbi:MULTISPECIES: hypothetical protein [Symbiopectobacterium]|uniref:hypothetical protein n=1 Tax=Symbiopectobacterium TaxID=801 RepID=UPI00207A92F8|nr:MULTISPECIES: hypothetical protein [Symbiopectobacterium]